MIQTGLGDVVMIFIIQHMLYIMFAFLLVSFSMVGGYVACKVAAAYFPKYRQYIRWAIPFAPLYGWLVIIIGTLAGFIMAVAASIIAIRDSIRYSTTVSSWWKQKKIVLEHEFGDA